MSFDQVMKDKKLHLYNMFIMKKRTLTNIAIGYLRSYLN